MENESDKTFHNDGIYNPEIVRNIKKENIDESSTSTSHDENSYVANQISDIFNLPQLKTEPSDTHESDGQFQIYGEELTPEEQLKLFTPYSQNDYEEHFKNTEELPSLEHSENILKNMLESNRIHKVNKGKKLVMVRKLKRHVNEITIPKHTNEVPAVKQAKEVIGLKQVKEITVRKQVKETILKQVTVSKQVKEDPDLKQVKEIIVPKHSPRHTEEFICNVCGKLFISQYYLSLHQAREKSVTSSKTETLTCKMCLKSYNNLTNVLDHILQVHKNVGECFDIQDYILKSDIEEDISNHVCLHCKKTFSNVLIFKNHLRIHTANHECVACNMSFKNKHELLTHRKEHLNKVSQTKDSKSEAEEKCDAPPAKKSDDRFRCDRCPVSFPLTALEEWTRHAATHIKKFRCDVCGKMFVLRSELDDHKIQHGALSHRVFRCTMCSKQFITLVELQKHGEVHRNQCSICKIFFTSYEHQKNHTHKLVGRYKCDLCVISFSSPLAVKQHKRLAHNNDYLIGKSK